MTFILSLLLGNRKIIAYAVAALAVAGAIWFYGNSQYRAGVTETTNKFIEADKKGAENVATTARKVLRESAGLDDAAITDSLRRNGGLRKPEGNAGIHGAE